MQVIMQQPLGRTVHVRRSRICCHAGRRNHSSVRFAGATSRPAQPRLVSAVAEEDFALCERAALASPTSVVDYRAAALGCTPFHQSVARGAGQGEGMSGRIGHKSWSQPPIGRRTGPSRPHRLTGTLHEIPCEVHQSLLGGVRARSMTSPRGPAYGVRSSAARISARAC